MLVVRLGIDAYSLRSQGWSAFEYLEYCSARGAKVVHFSEIGFLGGLEESHLRQVRVCAERFGLDLEIGMRSICPTSNLFDPSQGPAEEQLERMIHAARIIGSPIVRVVMGNRYDRRGGSPIEMHIENTIRVLRYVQGRALDAGIRIAIENHGGDLRAAELKILIEEAGTDFAGACLDSGNLVMTLDVPLAALEILAPYVLTSHIRDSLMWRTERGVGVMWVRMGEGNVDIRGYLRRYLELCPSRALTLETIAIEPRYLNCMEPEFWDAYPNVSARDFTAWLAVAEKGNAPDCAGRPPADRMAEQQREDLEANIQFCREFLSSSTPLRDMT